MRASFHPPQGEETVRVCVTVSKPCRGVWVFFLGWLGFFLVFVCVRAWCSAFTWRNGNKKFTVLVTAGGVLVAFRVVPRPMPFHLKAFHRISQ